MDGDEEAWSDAAEARKAPIGQLDDEDEEVGPIHTDKHAEFGFDPLLGSVEDPLIGVIPLENDSFPIFAPHQVELQSRGGKSTIGGSTLDFPKI